VIKAEFNLFEVEMKVLARNTSVMVEPSLGIGEETLNPIDVGSFSDILFLPMRDLLMPSSKGENTISSVIIGIEDTSSLGMLDDKRSESCPSPVKNREGKDLSVSLIHAEDQPFPFGSPAPLTLSSSTEEGLIELKFSREGFHFSSRSVIDGFPNDP